MTIVYHEDYLQQTQTYGHPECPERLAGIMLYLENNGVEVDRITPEPAQVADLLPVHTQEHVDLMQNFGEGHMDMDSYVWPHTYEMALLAAGGGLAAAKHAFEKKKPSFALVRPPGHHATRFQGGGFCYFNNIAVATASLLEKADKVAIVDVDVHHGNGTNDIFLDTDKVLFISTHQWGIYPGTGPAEQVGADSAEGFTVNIPLFSRSGDATFLEAYRRIAVPILEQYGPDMILVSLGLDAHYLDPLSSLTLSSRGYVEILGMMEKKAEELCEGRIAYFLEGGYNLNALTDVVGCAVARANGQELGTQLDECYDPDGIGIERVEHALAIQREFWKLE
jgi:acetoin utilization deacetylase AcuC-like enzyme